MAQEVKLGMDGTLLNWLKGVGDSVKAGEIIAEFEADKATVEVEAPADGVITELRGDVGAAAKEGDVIALLGAAGEAPAAAKSAPKAETAQPAQQTEEFATVKPASAPAKSLE